MNTAVAALVCLLPTAPPTADTLEARLAPLAEAHKGKVAIAVKHLVSGESFFYNADEVMPAASLIKLPILIEAYLQAIERKVKLTDSVTLRDADKVPGSGILAGNFSDGATFPLRDAVGLMAVFSDNTATNLVLDRIGIKTVNKRMKAWGLKETRLNAKVFRGDSTSVDPVRTKKYGLGSTTAREMVTLLETLQVSDRVRPAAKQAILGLLLRCDDKEKFTRFLPDVDIAHKTGSLRDVRTDAGIISLDDGAVVLCVLTADNADRSWRADNAGNLLCAGVAKAVYEHFTHSSKPVGKAGESKSKDELFLVGPFLLGDLCNKSERLMKFLDGIPKAGGPSTAEITKALNACKVSILDKRVNQSGKWRFAEGPYPRLVVEGQLSLRFKDKKGEEIRIHLEKAEVFHHSTDYTVSPPIRGRLEINFSLVFNPPVDGGIIYSDVTPAITYDINGKLR